MKKLLSLVLAMMMLLGVVVGSAQVAKADGPKSGGTLIKREAGDPVNFNPTLQSDDNGYATVEALVKGKFYTEWESEFNAEQIEY